MKMLRVIANYWADTVYSIAGGTNRLKRMIIC